jgi:Tfp pilus assembly protein PilF
MAKAHLISMALIAVLGAAVYSNAVTGEFVWDDRYLVKENALIKSPANIPAIFTEDIGAGAGIESSSYRPLQILAYNIIYSIWGLDVRPYHILNIALHILAAIGVYALARALSADHALAVIAAALFAAHPIHTESVSYISGTADPLSVAFLLTGLNIYILKAKGQGSWIVDRGSWLMVPVCYILALLSRETTLILPVLILIYHYAFKKKIEPARFAPIIGITILYIALRAAFIKTPLPSDFASTTVLERAPGFAVAVAEYTRLLIAPFGLHMEYGAGTFGIFEPRAILGIAILSGLAVFIVKIRTRVRPIYTFCALWFLAALLPSSNLYPINAYMAEHWLYLPSIAVFMAVAGALRGRFPLKVTIFISALLVAFYGYLTVKQNNYWSEPIGFYKRTLEYAPRSARLLNDMGIAYNERGETEEAIRSFMKAIDIDPRHPEAYDNIGKIYTNLGDARGSSGNNAEAIEFYKKAIEISPDAVAAYNNLGNVYKAAGRFDEAMELYKKALEISPGHPIILHNIKEIRNMEENRPG